MKKLLIFCAAFLMSATAFEAEADIFNFGGVRTKIYSFSNKSFEGAEKETRSMAAISGISNSGPLNVIYVQSEENKVEIMGDKELFCRVQTQYKNGTVNISLDAGTYRNLWLQVIVYAPSLDAIKCTGSGDFKAEKIHSNAEEMAVKVAGSATINIAEIQCERNLDFHVSGSGDIKASKTSCQLLDINVTGSGDVILQDTKCFNMDANVTGSGGIKFVKIEGNNADLSVTGSGDIRLEDGSIKYINARTTGSGDIRGAINYEHMDSKTTGSGSCHIVKR